MMKGTTSAQFALDYESEADCGRKLATIVGLSPLVTALTANSPLVAGRRCGDLSRRARAWLRTDDARTRIPTEVVESFSFEAYLDWALSVPMMFLRRDGQWVPAGGRSFAQWLDQGIDGRRPDMDDFDLHLTSLFPTVRVKGFLEIRGADNGSLHDILGLAAFWKGLLYDGSALEEAASVARAVESGGRRADLMELAITEGLAGRWAGRRLRTWIGLLLEIAERGLAKQGRRGPGEIAYLAPLRKRAARGRSPAVDVLDAWRSKRDVASFLATIAYPPVDSIPRVTPGEH
jgi:glutamate--cysteine ligase